MVEAVYKFSSGWLMFMELLTFVAVMLLTHDVKTVTCAAVTSRKFIRQDKHDHLHDSVSHVPPIDTTVQRDTAIDISNSPTTVSVDSDNLLVSQQQYPMSNVNSVTANRKQESTSVVKLSGFRTTSPYFFHTIAALSHAVTNQLKQSTVSDQKSLKKDVRAVTVPSITKRKRDPDEKHSKFESQSQKVSRKALRLPQALPEANEANNSFQNDKWPLNDLENISFSNSSGSANSTEMYERWDTPALYGESSNNSQEAVLSTNRLISNFTSNMSPFVNYSSDHTQVNEVSNETSGLERHIKVINSRDSAKNEWSPEGEHGPNFNVVTEMNDGVITSVSTNDLGINNTANSNIHGDVMSLLLAASESDEKLDAVSSSINTDGRVSETPDSFVETVNEMRQYNNNNGSITKQIFGAVKSTQLVELNDSAVYSEDQRSEFANQSAVAAENGVDDTVEVVKSVSDVTVLNSEVEDAIECELAGSEINESWVDTGEGNNAGNARRAEVARNIDFLSDSNIDSNVVSANLQHDLRYNETLKASIRGNVTVSSDWRGGNTAGEHDVRISGPSVVEQDSVMSSRAQREKLESLRVFKTRDAELSRLYSNNVNAFVLDSDQIRSGFAESLNSNETNARNKQQRDFENNSTKGVENLSLDVSFLHPQTGDGSDTSQPSGKNITLGPHRGISRDDNGTSVTYSENKKFELTDNALQGVSTLTRNRSNSVSEEGTNSLHSRSENVTFIADVFSTSMESQNYTTDRDMQQNATVSVSDKSAVQVTDYYNSSEIPYEFVPIRATSGITAEFNFEENSTSNSYNVKFSTPVYYDKDEGALSSPTPVLSTPETPVSVSASNGAGTAVSDMSAVSSSNGSASGDEQDWPVKLSAEVAGDLILGGLMMVHERQDNTTCGPIMPQGGIQALETMLYTLDVLNRDLKMIPNVTIGAHILDDCDKDTYGLEMAVDFIKGSISNIDGAEYHCNKTQVRKVISGVVGAASSVTSIQVANLLRLFKIPQVSFFSTSPELSNKQRFEFFSRTIPSDHYQVKAMVEIVKRMSWSYVSIIYEESNYGIKAFEELETLLAKNEICIAVKEKLVKDSGVAEETAYDNIVQKLLTKPRARGAIIFGSDQEVAGVMRAVRRNNATGAFSWIGSDGWSARNLVSDGNEAEVEGTLSVQPQANPVKGFDEYFLNLTVESNRRNPWFVEFWEGHFHCRYPKSVPTPYNKGYDKECDTTERLRRDNTAFEGQLQFVSDAVMAFAHAFKDMHQEVCHGQPGLCDAMKPIKGTELLKFLRKVTFKGLSGDNFCFDPNGDGPARYNIIHFKQISSGSFKWIKVGEYMEGELHLNMSEIQFKLGHPQPPESVCSLPCDEGQAKKYVEGERCCWHCFNCTQYQIRHPSDVTQCLTCPQGTVPDPSHITCSEIPEVFLRPESGCAIGAMSLSSTGILITLFVCGVFIRHNDTPVVRASGRELSYVLLTGILLCYCVTFALVLRPTDVVCGVQRFGAGFCFTVVYAALLTKTNRIARIFNAGKRTAKRPSLISPRSQLLICSGLVGFQVLINGVWILVSPPRAVHHYPTREDNHLVCSSHIDASYMIAFGYPILLIIVCTIYAVLTRKIPEAFNESKHIGFTMYTTCVIWLAFVPLYFGTGNHVPLRITSMSVTISLSASVTLACLFSPKLYIILVHPERNVRQSMMPVRYSAIKSPAVTGTTQTGSMMAAVVCNQQKQPLHSSVTQQSGSCQGLDSGLQSDGVDMELREDVVHQMQRRYQPCLVANQSTQTDAMAMNNSTSNANCPSIQQQQPQQQHQSIAKLTATCHIINSSSNGPISVSTAQQKQQIRDVQL